MITHGFIKKGEAVTISQSDIRPVEYVLADPAAVDRLEKIAAELKTIAPKAKDFLYFAAIMMHAAEASLLDDSGILRKDASGNDIAAEWAKEGDSWKWICSDQNIKPYKNANNDIFPEEELLKAHKQWIGRPLCLDHRSDSVDHIRGVIVDTYYDYPLKRVVALCALDKKTYPDLARKVTSKYATSVSMGTAVGRAICSDCGAVARVEADFCDHMRNKSCYGEINVDLKPLELSIVVSGADPGAQIKHVIAAADSISRYVDNKELLISRLSTDKSVEPELVSTLKTDLSNAIASLNSLQDKIIKSEVKEESNDSQIKVANDLNNLHMRLDKLQSDIDTLSKTSNEETNMTDKKAYFQGGGGVNEPSPGTPKYPSEDYKNLRDHVDKQMIGQMETGPVDGMHPGYDSFGESEEARKKRLLRMAAEQEERSLRRQAAADAAQAALESKGYFQGGGGDNEPTPGKAKYPVEPYTKYRDKEDKQMVGQKPFPGVGDIKGLHPSPASADQKDELRRKQMLSRAKLQARFYKAAGPDGHTEDKGKSSWHVFADNKLILMATVDEITNGQTDALYESVAHKDYGRKILGWVRTKDLGDVQAMLKSAQMAPPGGAAPAAPAGPMGDPMGGDMAGGDMGGEEMFGGGDGTPQDEIPELLTQAENTISDLREAFDALLEEPGSELDEFSEMAEMPRAAYYKKMKGVQRKVGNAIAVGMKKAMSELNEQSEELRMAKHIHENKDKVKGSDYKFACQLTEEAVKDVKSSIKDSYKLMEAFVRYARGTDALIKQAKKEAALIKNAQGSEFYSDEPYHITYTDALGEQTTAVVNSQGLEGADLPAGQISMQEAQVIAPAEIQRTMESRQHDPLYAGDKPAGDMSDETAYIPAGGAQSPVEVGEEGTGGLQAPDTWGEMLEQRNQMAPLIDTPLMDAEMMADDGMVDNNATEDDKKDKGKPDVELPEDEIFGKAKPKPKPEEKPKAASIEVTDDRGTKEGRAALRDKLAQKGLQFSDMLNKAHPGGGETTDLDVKPTGDLAKVERLDEQHAKHMEVALAPPRVRQAAEEIQMLVVKGQLNPTDEMFATLIAEGLDSAAVSYWKQFYGQAKDGGGQFASELVKEKYAKDMSNKMETYRVKIARAYELTNDMVRKGMLNNHKSTVDGQIRELMNFNDEGFTSFKRYVERQPTVKLASMPQIGSMGSSYAEIVLPAPEAKNDFGDALNEALSQVGHSRRMF